MKIGTRKLKILLTIGREPNLNKEELADEVNESKNYVSSAINDFRNFSLVLKTVLDEDREKGLRWELTGQGKRKIDEELEKLEKKLGLKIENPTLHVYRPPHAR